MRERPSWLRGVVVAVIVGAMLLFGARAITTRTAERAIEAQAAAHAGARTFVGSRHPPGNRGWFYGTRGRPHKVLRCVMQLQLFSVKEVKADLA